MINTAPVVLLPRHSSASRTRRTGGTRRNTPKGPTLSLANTREHTHDCKHAHARIALQTVRPVRLAAPQRSPTRATSHEPFHPTALPVSSHDHHPSRARVADYQRPWLEPVSTPAFLMSAIFCWCALFSAASAAACAALFSRLAFAADSRRALRIVCDIVIRSRPCIRDHLRMSGVLRRQIRRLPRLASLDSLAALRRAAARRRSRRCPPPCSRSCP